MQREEYWTKSIATGSRSYIEAVKFQMGSFAVGRQIRKHAAGFELREDQSPYIAFFDAEKHDIEGENVLFWNA